MPAAPATIATVSATIGIPHRGRSRDAGTASVDHVRPFDGSVALSPGLRSAPLPPEGEAEGRRAPSGAPCGALGVSVPPSERSEKGGFAVHARSACECEQADLGKDGSLGSVLAMCRADPGGWRKRLSHCRAGVRGLSSAEPPRLQSMVAKHRCGAGRARGRAGRDGLVLDLAAAHPGIVLFADKGFWGREYQASMNLINIDIITPPSATVSASARPPRSPRPASV
jgi:hypothetical protein